MLNNTETELFQMPTFLPALAKDMEKSLGSLLKWKSKDTISTLIGDLRPHTDYTFRVAAITNAGTGLPANITLKTQEDHPGWPQNLAYKSLSSTSVNVTWDKPDQPNGVIVRYTIAVENGGLKLESTQHTYYVLTNLKKHHIYKVV